MDTSVQQPFQLFQRGKTYWVRFSIKGQGQQRFSLGTKDEAEAQRLAQQKYQHSVWSADQGLLAGKTSFDKVANQYVGHLIELAKANPKKVSIVQADLAFRVRALGLDVILENGFWKRSERDSYRQRAVSCGASMQLYYMDVPRESLKSRIIARNASARNSFYIPPESIDAWADQFECPTSEEQPIVVP